MFVRACSSLSIFVFFLFVFSFFVYLDPSFADMGYMLRGHLRAKYGEAVNESVHANVADLRNLVSELPAPQLTAVFAES